MTQFKTEHGVIVDVDDALAARIGGKWGPVDGGDEAPQGAPDASWKIDQLKAYAAEHDIDLGVAKKKEQLLEVIAAHAGNVGEDDEDDGDDGDDETSETGDDNSGS